jgi:hypothetical protein
MPPAISWQGHKNIYKLSTNFLKQILKTNLIVIMIINQSQQICATNSLQFFLVATPILLLSDKDRISSEICVQYHTLNFPAQHSPLPHDGLFLYFLFFPLFKFFPRFFLHFPNHDKIDFHAFVL